MMKKDRNKLLLPCYRDMDPYDMPEQLSVLQSYDMSKIGFIQDLIRGIKKVLDADKKPEVIHETVTVQRTNSNIVALLKRGSMALEDSEWDKADQFFEEVLNQDAECAEAYIGKVLADKECMNLDELVQQILRSYEVTEPCKHIILVDESVIKSAVAQYSVPRYYSESEIRQAYEMFDLTYESYVENRIQQKEDAENAWNMNRDLMRATRFADPVTAQKLNDTKKKMLETMDARTAEALEEQEKAKAEREAAYQKHLARVNEETFQKHKEAENRRHEDYLIFRRLLENSQDIRELNELLMRFEEMGDYLDCAELVSRCREEKVKVLERRKEEESRKEEERRKEIEKRRKEVEARRIEEARRVKQQYEERTATWRNAGVCQHCGGKFKGLFIEKCANCGRTKDY
jgi:hypothetical protein